MVGLEAAEEGEGEGEVGEKVGREGGEGSGVGVGWWEGAGHDGGNLMEAEIAMFSGDDQINECRVFCTVMAFQSSY